MLLRSGLGLSDTIDISWGLVSSSSSKTDRNDDKLDSPTERSQLPIVWLEDPPRLLDWLLRESLEDPPELLEVLHRELCE